MTQAQIIAEDYIAAWKARCPNTPLLVSESHRPFELAIGSAANTAVEETRIYKFHDGSKLICSTDLNGHHALQVEFSRTY